MGLDLDDGPAQCEAVLRRGATLEVAQRRCGRVMAQRAA
jgi:hypothetical protein